MQVFRKIFNVKYNFFCGLLAFLLYSISFLIGYGDEMAGHTFVLSKVGLITIAGMLFLVSCREDSLESIKAQYASLGLVVLCYELLLFFAVGRTIVSIRDYSAIINSIVWISCGFIAFFRFKHAFFSTCKTIMRDEVNKKLSIAAIVLSLVVIVLSLEPNGIRFIWDSDTLYEFIYGLDYRAFYDANLTTFHSHVSTVYAQILLLFKLLFKDVRIAFFLLNSLCTMATSLGMVFSLKSLIPGKAPFLYVLADAVFLFSPWICGLSTYHMYDYYIWCLFPVLVCCYLNNNYIGFFVVGVMITFSKASGLIVFGSVCGAILIVDLVGKMEDKGYTRKKDLFFAMVKNIKYWYFAMVAVVFFLMFKLGIDKSTQFEDTRIAFDIRHISQQLKMYGTFNFLWVYVGLSLALLIALVTGKERQINATGKSNLYVIYLADFLFIVFNCVCVTFRIPRYMGSHISAVYICACVMLLCISKKLIVVVLCLLLSVLSLMSSFITIDPVTLALFKQIDIGGHKIVHSDQSAKSPINDFIVYNREYYAYDVALGKAIKYALDNKCDADELVFSLGRQSNTWNFSGGRYSYVQGDEKRDFALFYDKTINGLANGYEYDYYSSEDMIPFNLHYVFSGETIAESLSDCDANKYYYIYMPTLNDGKEKEIINNYHIIDENEFSFRGWELKCIEFTVK